MVGLDQEWWNRTRDGGIGPGMVCETRDRTRDGRIEHGIG